jgi:ferredoxin-NADP reductase/DMSO/TMAO reductase YedYZ heme-binding membrane subunit
MRAKRLSWLAPGVVAGAFVPLVVLIELTATRQLGANPISIILNQLGFVALVLLVGSLACTPLKTVTRWKWPIRIRKPLGVMGFVYALLHFFVYVGLDQLFNLKTILQDISKRPFIMIGFAALLMLVPLAATSTNRASRRLGKNWKKLHRLVYLISPLVIIHFIMRMKADIRQPVVYGAVIAVLIAARVVNAAIKRWNAPAWDGYRKFKIARKEFEPGQVCSCYLKGLDAKKLPSYKAGQYLTVKIDLGEPHGSVIRCYSLFTRPDPTGYHISVKRVPSGIASNFFHDRLSEGSVIDVKAPKGKFFVKSFSRRPLVLIGGGIGVTPVLAMLDALAASGARRPIYFFFGVRNSSEHCFREQLSNISSRNNGVKLHVCYSSPLPHDRVGIDCHSTGRISVELLKEVFPSLDCDFYVCGPASMMAQLKADLAAAGVPARNFHMEAFGAGSVKRMTGPGAAAERLIVAFELSGKTLEWEPKYGNLLELAEANGIEIECGCRAGNCGSCEVEIGSGEVEYLVEPGAAPDEGACLLCVTVPITDLSLKA